VNPLSNHSTKYSTRRKSQGLVNFIPEPENVYRRRLNKITSCKILNSLLFESISNIHTLFNNLQVEEMDDYFSPLDFAQINGYPHALPEKDIEKFCSFQGNNVVSVKYHLKYFSSCINKWCSSATHNH